MAELLFIATTIFVAYVIFEVVSKKDKTESKQASTASGPDSEPPAVAEKVSTPPAQASKPAPKKTASPAKKTPTVKKAPAAKAADSSANSLRNPKTGEVAKIPNSYAFAKRWIKEALVEEGLLDKIYKSNELDTVNAEKIKAALEQLKSLEKYQ